jgi:protein-S-isoprenylcysteine O-methyltransferase Ste14
MSTQETAISVASFRSDSLRMCGSAALTYAAGLWIVLFNPSIYSQNYRGPINLNNLPVIAHIFLAIFFFVIGKTPAECLLRVAAIALTIQVICAYSDDKDKINLEDYRPYVFWRAIYRFLVGCKPFLLGKAVDSPPSTSLTEFERVTVRYFFVKLIFLPMMIAIFYGNVQQVIGLFGAPYNAGHLTSSAHIERLYEAAYYVLMTIDVGWFAICCSMETSKYSPVKTVDPYASGWLVTLACYPPMVWVSSQYLVWSVPQFPSVNISGEALFFGIAGIILYTLYVISDLSFGLKAGNLTYRGLVEKGPYRVIRHPMYATKNFAWFLFTLPAINFHVQMIGTDHFSLPILMANWYIIWPMMAWITIYAMRGITEERYLLAFPEYREYCKRVKYRFIPGVL